MASRLSRTIRSHTTPRRRSLLYKIISHPYACALRHTGGSLYAQSAREIQELLDDQENEML
ncbi:hypothetical protein TC41_3118 [Alicyclobacillus acidocaldarius subsp. acidocaldarius Tc-4-1]|uniref:Uncharacterized protein n=1 Tax=Alicyclobacillus acidocaldarius (strain Tc-4-1) TaxID=1048834 RepID=F8ICZ7_ALIAT|nr:hypothetical protein TC41_3118 [Alicyclobacillus acidocaldarius subsp. acidocaldarius Tc-4-1]